MDQKTRKLIENLLTALQRASGEIEELGCTCVDRSNGHQPGCVGVNSSKDYEKDIDAAKQALLPPKCQTQFPMEYKGWRIEIRMGHEMGCRGSVANRRGYVATSLKDGKVQEFKPSYSGSACLSAVKALIDVEERMQQKYASK